MSVLSVAFRTWSDPPSSTSRAGSMEGAATSLRGGEPAGVCWLGGAAERGLLLFREEGDRLDRLVGVWRDFSLGLIERRSPVWCSGQP